MSEEALERRNGGTSERGNEGTVERRNVASESRSAVPSFRRSFVPPVVPPPPEPVIIAESPAMRRAVELARRFAPLNLPVLLVGETGTGKEVFAQAIHRWSGRSGELVDVDCGALPAGMVVAELYGHRRGAYTTAVDSMPGLLEQAHGGTLFLDELGSLSMEGQAALLRVLETGQLRRVGDRTKLRVDLRAVAAIQEEGSRLVDTGRLRPDLWHRFSGCVIRLCPLRERLEETGTLAVHFARLGGRQISRSGIRVLFNYSWPGNVRELRQVVLRAAGLTDDAVLCAGTMAEAIDLGTNLSTRGGHCDPNQIDAEARRLMLGLCQAHDWQAEAIAGVLGIARSTLYRRLQRLGIRLLTESQVAQSREFLRLGEKK